MRCAVCLNGGNATLAFEDIINTAQLKRLCASFAGAESTLYGAPSNILVYAVGEKKFAYFKTSAPEQWRFSLRVTPARFVELTGVPGIKPARYMGRFHWVTIVNLHSLPPGYLAELVEWSYRKALGALSKQRQASLALPQAASTGVE